MRAIVLVGGEGTRLRPLTHRTPKQLVPVLNRPLLEHLLLHLRSHGVTRVTLAMTRPSEPIRSAIADGDALGLAVDYAYEETPLGSGGAIANAVSSWDRRPGGPFLIVNGDIITDLDVTAMLAAHRERRAELTISLHEVDDPSAFGVVALDRAPGDEVPSARISRFVEKPPIEDAPSRLVNAGTWIFEPSLLDKLDATSFHRVEDGLFPDLADSARAIDGFTSPAYWMDVGSPEAYLRVNLELAAGAIPSLRPAGPDEGVLLGNGVAIAGDASLVARAVAGDGCTIDAGACVQESVLWDGVHVGAGAEVRGSVLASGVEVGPGAVVEGAVVAHEAVIAAGARVGPGTLLEPGARIEKATPNAEPARSH
jgi:mannose-1-phosphate guanylyltransferase